MNMNARLLSALGTVLMLGAAGCAEAGSEPDGKLGATRQAQVDSGSKVWRDITLTLHDANVELGHVRVFNQAIGDYDTDTEYWYINRSNLSYLGTDGAIMFTVTDSESTTAPSAPSYTSQQSFQLDESVSWGTGWTSDPLSGGHLYYRDTSGVGLRLTTSGSLLTHVAWYQVIGFHDTPANITPSDGFVLSTDPVSVGEDMLGYDVNQTID